MTDFQSRAEAEPLGKAELCMEYSTHKDFGAAFPARPKLIKHMTNNELFFKRWDQQNFARLVKEHDIIDKYGFQTIQKPIKGHSVPYQPSEGNRRLYLLGSLTKHISPWERC